MIINKEREIHKIKNTTNQIFTSQNNMDIISELLLENKTENGCLFKKEIENKINGYKNQDVIKNIFDSINKSTEILIIDYDFSKIIIAFKGFY